MAREPLKPVDVAAEEAAWSQGLHAWLLRQPGSSAAVPDVLRAGFGAPLDLQLATGKDTTSLWRSFPHMWEYVPCRWHGHPSWVLDGRKVSAFFKSYADWSVFELNESLPMIVAAAPGLAAEAALDEALDYLAKMGRSKRPTGLRK
ncbi:hypothetical protein HXX76_001887 [Chlamydomonas incerta]|uniref:Uncharacterized protein n=1 Tax=Chlamydomonas incerta TaxID=51695 RepID=A0A835TQK9_CHLIN|nr:hypothetical protein HXX76_001887 [Chlamydomonas incerta]|eukprot:KAG2443535.1 hypothetical protein HXX76_001887 [Chlamydomonas incerta]